MSYEIFKNLEKPVRDSIMRTMEVEVTRRLKFGFHCAGLKDITTEVWIKPFGYVVDSVAYTIYYKGKVVNEDLVTVDKFDFEGDGQIDGLEDKIDSFVKHFLAITEHFNLIER